MAREAQRITEGVPSRAASPWHSGCSNRPRPPSPPETDERRPHRFSVLHYYMGRAPTHGSPRRLDTTRIESSGTEATVAARTTARTTTHTHTHTVWWLGARTCAMPHIPHSIILKVTRHISSPRNMKVVWVNGWLNDRSGHVPSSDALGDPWMDSVPLGVHCPVAFCMSASLVEIWGRERRGGGGVGVSGRVRVGVRVVGMDGGKDLQCARVKAARARARRPDGSGLCRGTPGTPQHKGPLQTPSLSVVRSPHAPC